MKNLLEALIRPYSTTWRETNEMLTGVIKGRDANVAIGKGVFVRQDRLGEIVNHVTGKLLTTDTHFYCAAVGPTGITNVAGEIRVDCIAEGFKGDHRKITVRIDGNVPSSLLDDLISKHQTV